MSETKEQIEARLKLAKEQVEYEMDRLGKKHGCAFVPALHYTDQGIVAILNIKNTKEE